MALFERLKQMLRPDIIINKEKDSAERKYTSNIGESTVYGKLLTSTESEKQKQVTLLTPRERDLYLLLLEGFTLKESAEQLLIKYSTANTHMTGIYKKLGVKTRAELIINYREIKGDKLNS
jgi:DNA-binding CsgD family transcriptional regulator